MVRCLADDLIKKGMRVELKYSAGNRKPNIVAKDGLGVAPPRNKIEKYMDNSSLVDDIAERFGVGAGSVRVEAITSVVS